MNQGLAVCHRAILAVLLAFVIMLAPLQQALAQAQMPDPMQVAAPPSVLGGINPGGVARTLVSNCSGGRFDTFSLIMMGVAVGVVVGAAVYQGVKVYRANKKLKREALAEQQKYLQVQEELKAKHNAVNERIAHEAEAAAQGEFGIHPTEIHVRSEVKDEEQNGELFSYPAPAMQSADTPPSSPDTSTHEPDGSNQELDSILPPAQPTTPEQPAPAQPTPPQPTPPQPTPSDPAPSDAPQSDAVSP